MQNLNHYGLDGEVVVDEAIQPGKAGRVRFQGSWWYARCDKDVTLLPGEVASVVGLSNITLLVEPIPKGNVANSSTAVL